MTAARYQLTLSLESKLGLDLAVHLNQGDHYGLAAGTVVKPWIAIGGWGLCVTWYCGRSGQGLCPLGQRAAGPSLPTPLFASQGGTNFSTMSWPMVC